MRHIVLTTFVLSSFAAPPVAMVYLTGPPANFPTNESSVTGCSAAFDSDVKKPPDYCKPFSITLEVQGEKSATSSERGGAVALEVLITNTSDRAIKLPASPKQTLGGQNVTFISLGIFSPPESLKVTTLAYAFGDANNGSSVVTVGPHEGIIYLIPFDKAGLNSSVDGIHIQVKLTAYLLERGKARSSGDLSAQQGNPILSKPFTLPN